VQSFLLLLTVRNWPAGTNNGQGELPAGLFGSGLPFLKETDFERKLNLEEVRKLNANTIQIHYTIQK